MAGWLIAALSLLSGFGARAVARAGPLARRGAIPALTGVAGVAAGNLGIPGVDLFPGGGSEGPRRRRRRRALTASDRADIAFIESILGKAAGKSFAMIIATRT